MFDVYVYDSNIIIIYIKYCLNMNKDMQNILILVLNNLY